VVETAAKRGLRIVFHDISRAVHKFYSDAATVLRKTAEETERTDHGARTAFDDLEHGGRHDMHASVGVGTIEKRSSGLAKEPAALRKTEGQLPAGLEPTAQSIHEGTVRMEAHPEYGRVQSEMAAAGYPLEPGAPPPHVDRIQYVDRAGNVLRVEQRIVVQPGMRFLDLEHEVGHVGQLTDRFGGNPPFTDRRMERPNGSTRPANDRSGVLSPRQNDITEFHNRLQEYNRLAERGVSPELLAEHGRELDHWYNQYQDAVATGWNNKATTTGAWATKHFADIRGLMGRYQELGGTLSRRFS
jgi:hypothetical protein